MIHSQARPWALVTGAASGIGFEIARELAERGYDLLLTARGHALEKAATRLRTSGARVETLRADTSTFNGVEAVAGRTEAAGRPLAFASLNAGETFFADGEDDLHDELRSLQRSVVSTVHLAKRIAGIMRESRSGRILFTSTPSGCARSLHEGISGASKAFVESFAESLGRNLNGSGVTVTTLLPVPTDLRYFRREGGETYAGGRPMISPPPAVAARAVTAALAGQGTVVAGPWLSKLEAYATNFSAYGESTPEKSRVA